MKKTIQRLLATTVAVALIGTYVAAPVAGQRTPPTPEQMKRHALQMKSWVEADAKAHPKWRMLITFRDGTQAAGRIREVHENDFVLKQDGNFPERTIAYTEIDLRPQHLTPMAEKIAEYTGCTILFVIFFPLILLSALTGGLD